ncbi:hypothetical protein ACIHAX_07760 [Nocardia sp. NPDC051929]|uniref:hypothetical protein n=1 Tax=Nocardia sp. NPDC051929 TaxID=3364327 RepID=UPI0037C56E77
MHTLAMYQLIAMCQDQAHQAPVVPFTVYQAHQVMQIHRACRAKHCRRKDAALQTLIEAGRVIASTTKPR